MNMREKIKRYAKELKISDVGICRARVFDELRDIFEKTQTPFVPKAEKRISPFDFVAGAKSIIMCVFGYYTGKCDANISKYAYGRDYHEVVSEKLKSLCDMLEQDCGKFERYIFCDNSPLCDRYLAYLAGLGIMGKNHLLIHPVYGSYVFVGGIVTDLDIEEDAPLDGGCSGCGKCAQMCPGGALAPDGSFDAKKCVSYITQKKGDLSDSELDILRQGKKIWGCDVCSDVCPHNENAKMADIAEFYAENPDITASDLEDEAAFFANLHGRAFTWRGYDTIRRNFDITKNR